MEYIIVAIAITLLVVWATLEGDSPFSAANRTDKAEQVYHTVGFVVVDHTTNTYCDEVFNSYVEATRYMDYLQKCRVGHRLSVRPVDGL